MEINALYACRGVVIRVLGLVGNRALVINCLEKKVPYWLNMETECNWKPMTQEQFLKETKTNFPSFDEITEDKRKLIQERYGTISLILPFLTDEAERNSAIDICAKKFKLSKATIRARLCAFLIHQDIRVFLPNQTKEEKPLTNDEKNFRWALNKYYYKAIKIPLVEAYRRMLKDKYCDEDGKLLSKVPSFRRFSYYFQKTATKENLIISREGKGKFLRNNRVMLGNGIRDFCPSIGYGMFDSTICDIFLVNDNGELLGRPILTACVDGYTSMCLGYYIGFSGGVHSLNKLLDNICEDKQKHCRKFGIDIDKEDWDCSQLPHKFITDKGREYVSETFSQITDLGIEIINLPPYRPDLKSAVEKFFDIVQGYYKKDIASKGVIFEDYQERGGKDYRKNATFTLEEFEKILLLCIIKYNTKRIIDLPYDVLDEVQPFANKLWNSCLTKYQHNLLDITKEKLEQTLLPRTVGTFKRNGLIVNGLRYKNLKFTERYLKGGGVVVAYNPSNVSKVWLLEKGKYEEFEIIESFFKDMDLESVGAIQDKKSEVEKQAQEESLQASIDLSRELELIAKTHATTNPSLDNVRRNRRTEKIKEGNNG